MHHFKFILTAHVLLPEHAEHAAELNAPTSSDLLPDSFFRRLHLCGRGSLEWRPMPGDSITLSAESGFMLNDVEHVVHANHTVVRADSPFLYAPEEYHDAVEDLFATAESVMGLTEVLDGWLIENAKGFVIAELPEVRADFVDRVLLECTPTPEGD